MLTSSHHTTERSVLLLATTPGSAMTITRQMTRHSCTTQRNKRRGHQNGSVVTNHNRLRNMEQRQQQQPETQSNSHSKTFFLKCSPSSVFFVAVVLASLMACSSALENGLARTPPMGWLAWERFRCNTDCYNDPHHCISERLFRQMADIVVSDGYYDVGDNYINVDDCWLSHDRDRHGRLQADPVRFPSGIPALADYVHRKGMKFGIYEDYGNFTCAGYPGILGHLETDADTFASWGVDYVKLDGCYSHPNDMDKGYPEFGYFLNRTGRPMLYACSWPVYQTYSGMQPNYTAITGTCNLWRNFDDIQDSWQSVASVIDYYGDNQDTIIPNAGPGQWNDPDMLIIGNFGLSYEQSKTQMAMWAIFAAPLLMSVDLRTIRPEYKAILQNKKIIRVNQDRLGIQGRRIYKQKGIEIWARPILPVSRGKYSYAIVFLNRRTDGTPSEVSVTLRELGLDNTAGYHITDLYDDYDYGIVTPERRFKVDVNPSGSVVMIRADIYKGKIGFENFIEAGRDAQPRRDDSGLVVDHGHVGVIENADGHHPRGGRFPSPPNTLHANLFSRPPFEATTAAPFAHTTSHVPRSIDEFDLHGFPDQRFSRNRHFNKK